MGIFRLISWHFKLAAGRLMIAVAALFVFLDRMSPHGHTMLLATVKYRCSRFSHVINREIVQQGKIYDYPLIFSF